MPWNKVIGCEDYLGVNWVHPLKQRAVGEVVSLIRTQYPDVYALAVFGSATTDMCRVDSDIDLVVWQTVPSRFILPACDEFDLLYANSISRDSQIWKSIVEEGIVVYVKNTDCQSKC